jgi:cobalt/nickel transport system ATP-binding protein
VETLKKDGNPLIIEFEKVNFYYTKGKPIICDVDLQIHRGESIGIVGTNGAGKSTLLKLITGLILPISGSIYVDRQKVIAQNLKAIRKKVGYAFQEPDNQLFMPTVAEDVGFFARQQGIPEEEIKKIVDNALNQVNALHLGPCPPYQLSGGEKRIATIATVLASSPEVLLLDEPSVGLDPKSRRNLIHLLDQRLETKIIATHDMDLAMDLCDRIIIMYQGKICADDQPKSIFSQEALLSKYHLEKPLVLQGCPNCTPKS